MGIADPGSEGDLYPWSKRSSHDKDEELETANEEMVQVKALDIESERKAGKAKLTLLRLAAGK